jgi:hypothetical protein
MISNSSTGLHWVEEVQVLDVHLVVAFVHMRRVLIIAFLLLLLPPTLQAGLWVAEGEPPFTFAAWFGTPPRLGQMARLWFTMAGSYDSTANGVARIVLPPNLELIEGDTLYKGRPLGPTKNWVMTVRPTQLGDYEVRASLKVLSAGQTADEADLLLRFRLDSTGASAEPSTNTRLETIRSGQRYRYGGRYLVPIPQSESFTQMEIDRGGGKAKVVSAAPAVCLSCNSQSDIPYVVFLDENGTITSSRQPWVTRRLPANVDSAIQNALGEWKFEPSQVNGQAVPDWLLIKVTVMRR